MVKVVECKETEAEAQVYADLEVTGRRLRDAMHAYAAGLKARDLLYGAEQTKQTDNERWEEIIEVVNQEWGGPWDKPMNKSAR